LVRDPFTPHARLDHERLVAIVKIAVRLLDNVIDISHFPLPQQQATVRRSRRIGLGVTGLADAMIMLGLRYGSEGSLAFASDTMRVVCHTAYLASISIAREKGSFPAFEVKSYLDGAFIRSLPSNIRDGIARCGIRNSHLLAIAPTGTISMFAGNVSSGIEPVFAAETTRQVLDPNDATQTFTTPDWAVALWRQTTAGGSGTPPRTDYRGRLARREPSGDASSPPALRR
jgi:ribonucleoside-diphosphate reductase alpha chain